MHAWQVRSETVIIAERVTKEYAAKGLDMLALEKQFMEAAKEEQEDD